MAKSTDDMKVEYVIPLLSFATGLSPIHLGYAVLASLSFYLLLVLIDVTLGTHAKKEEEETETHRPFPKSWNCDNSKCYMEMFSEPTRHGRLIRRPGNTLSNILYLFGGLSVLGGAMQRGLLEPFVVPDAIYGIMLLVLAFSSTAWHGCNPPRIHYVDLWSMEACTIYLAIRCLSIGIYQCFKNYASESFNHFITIEHTASVFCLVLFLIHIFANGKKWYTLCQKQVLHHSCPFSVRSRLGATIKLKDILIGKSSRDGLMATFTPAFTTIPPISILHVCLFALIPISLFLPIYLIIYYTGETGSTRAYLWTNTSLILGWTYRLWEQWALDGCVFMKWWARGENQGTSQYQKDHSNRRNSNNGSSFLRMILSAFFSPTAVLHIATGVTLLAGYTHMRSFDLILLDHSN
eukprot:CAMPEP_0184870310 /NCGR_PEP_ID=MMETSP0580-20130426/37057_1 /TAXON_ID=1118495 /ORGANISM="Dactyliosolen fragilissimus" /LENGTH=406 /DNA_ID=CAMNT_0027372325 /DNA_START=208 /DNA_END=1428 /DNA_ORIENTATION=-